MTFTSNENIVIVVPARNESEVIRSVLTELIEQNYRVVCVDDGSTDTTSQIARQCGAIVVSHAINLGQGAAIETGFELIRRGLVNCTYVATFDADGQHDVSDIRKMADFLDSGEYSLVLGNRFLGEKSNVPFIKSLLLRSAAKLTSVFGRIQISDTQNGLRMLTTDTIKMFHLSEAGYGHADEFIKLIGDLKLPFCEVPVNVKYTDYSKSRGQPLINIIRLAFDKFLGIR